MDEKLSCNKVEFGIYVHMVYTLEFDMNKIEGSAWSDSYSDIQCTFENTERLRTMLFDKRNDYISPIVNISHKS